MTKLKLVFASLFLLLAAALPARAQYLVQGGALPIVVGRTATWIFNGILGNGEGSAGCTSTGCNPITDFGITASGTPFCIYDAFTDSAAGYHQFCLGANTMIGEDSGAFLTYNAYGGATPEALTINLNGVNYPFPGSGYGNVIGPTSPEPSPYDLVIWNGGTAVKDGGLLNINMVTQEGCDPTGINPCDSGLAAALELQATNGVPIYFPAGTYSFENTIAVTAGNAVIECQGQFTTTLVETTSNQNLITWGSATYQTDTNPITNGRIRNCTLENPGAGGTPTAGAIIQANRVAGLKIQDDTLWQGFDGLVFYGNPATYQTLVSDVEGFGLTQTARMPGSAMVSIDKVTVASSLSGTTQDPATGTWFKPSEGMFIQNDLFYGGSSALPGAIQWGISIAEDDGTLIGDDYVSGVYGADLHFEQSTVVSGYIDENIGPDFFDQGNGAGSMPYTIYFQGNTALGTNGLTADVTYTSGNATISFTSASGTLQNGEAIDDPMTCGGGSSPCLVSRQHFLYNVSQSGSSGTAQVSYTGSGGAVTADPAANNGTAQATDFNAFGSFMGMSFNGVRMHGGSSSCLSIDANMPPNIPDELNITGGICATSGGSFTNDGIDILGSPDNLSESGLSIYVDAPAIGIYVANGNHLNFNGGLISGGDYGMQVAGANTATVTASNIMMSAQSTWDTLITSTFLTAGVLNNITGMTGSTSNPGSECTIASATTIAYSPACPVVELTGTTEVEGINTDPTQPSGRMNGNPGQVVEFLIEGSMSILNCTSCSSATNIRMDSSYASPGSAISLAAGDAVWGQWDGTLFIISSIARP